LISIVGYALMEILQRVLVSSNAVIQLFSELIIIFAGLIIGKYFGWKYDSGKLNGRIKTFF
jgi:hypothetical protein